MRRAIGIVLVVLGVGLVAFAGLARYVISPSLSVAPLDLDPNQPSENSGTATMFFDFGTLTAKTDVPVFSNRFTKALTEESAQLGGNVGVYRSFTSVVDGNDEILTPVDAPATYAFDRTTSVLQAEGSTVGGTALTADEVAGDALMPLKFPFWVQQKSYSYFDDSIRRGMQMDFVGTEDVQGLQTYRFEGTVEPTQVGESADAAALMPGAPAGFAAPIIYSVQRTLWVDPTTGRIVNGVDKTRQVLRGPDGSDAIVAFDGSVGYTEQNVTDSVAAAKSDASKLQLITTTLPLVALVVGLVLAVVGGWLVIADHRRRRAEVSAEPSSLAGIGIGA